MRGVLFAAALVLGASPALAEGAPKSAAFEACAAKTHGATFPLLHCYAVEMQARDAAANAAYDAALQAATDPKTKDFIQRSQTSWTAYRDAWCEATVPRSGSMARIRLMECRLNETARRALELGQLTH